LGIPSLRFNPTGNRSNVRKTGADPGVDELAASIAAHGLLQTLIVRPGAGGKFEVVAGGRRLAALKRQAEAGRDFGVEVSLAEIST
jgi:hypothetical protein